MLCLCIAHTKSPSTQALTRAGWWYAFLAKQFFFLFFVWFASEKVRSFCHTRTRLSTLLQHFTGWLHPKFRTHRWARQMANNGTVKHFCLFWMTPSHEQIHRHKLRISMQIIWNDSIDFFPKQTVEWLLRTIVRFLSSKSKYQFYSYYSGIYHNIWEFSTIFGNFSLINTILFFFIFIDIVVYMAYIVIYGRSLFPYFVRLPRSLRLLRCDPSNWFSSTLASFECTQHTIPWHGINSIPKRRKVCRMDLNSCAVAVVKGRQMRSIA